MTTPANPIDTFIRVVAEIHDGTLPTGSLTVIGKYCGVSRERVRQRANRIGVLTPRKTPKPLRICQRFSCTQPIPDGHPARKYCSFECKKLVYAEKYWTETPCNICKKPIKHLKSHGENHGRPRYCSYSCRSKAISHPFGRIPKYPKTGADLRALFNSRLGRTTFTSLEFASVMQCRYLTAQNIKQGYVHDGLIARVPFSKQPVLYTIVA